jgi:hypothetical protein
MTHFARPLRGRYNPFTRPTQATHYHAFTMRNSIFTAVCRLLLLTAYTAHGAADPPPPEPEPEPGPASGGLRLRLVVAPNPAENAQAGYNVRLELLNVSTGDITLRANWRRQENDGDFKDYLEAATSIETYPPVAPWIGQVLAGHRISPQPERVLKPGEVLSVRWRTTGRLLKNEVTDPNAVQNPQLAAPGLYSVHATVVVNTPRAPVRLRSNEQLVPAGGSREMPKHTYGELGAVDAGARTATLNLGSLHKVTPGDQFRIRTGMLDCWKLTITQVQPEFSTGRLEPEPMPMESSRRAPNLPERRMTATLLSPPSQQ